MKTIYKSILIPNSPTGFDIQVGRTEGLQKLDERINLFAENGWELVSITPCPCPMNVAKVSFLILFKKEVTEESKD